jgi:hypothetical protein
MARLWIDGQWVDKNKPVPAETEVVKPEELPEIKDVWPEISEALKPKRTRTKKEQV